MILFSRQTNLSKQFYQCGNFKFNMIKFGVVKSSLAKVKNEIEKKTYQLILLLKLSKLINDINIETAEESPEVDKLESLVRSSKAAQRVLDSSKKFEENFLNPSNENNKNSNFENQVNSYEILDFYQ